MTKIAASALGLGLVSSAARMAKGGSRISAAPAVKAPAPSAVAPQ